MGRHTDILGMILGAGKMPISDSTTFAICYGAWGSPNACEGAIICLDGKASQGESICNATMATRNPIRWHRSVALS